MNLKNLNIPLVKDTIDSTDIKKLVKWLEDEPRLTKGKQTIEFEKKWSEYIGTKYSVFVNSGSSANLAMLYALMISDKLRNNKIILPSISWVTTVAPAIQLNLEPVLCDCDKETLGLDIEHLKYLIKTESPSAIMLVHVLGVPNKMQEIIDLCNDNDIILLEDSCESIGSTYDNIKTGGFGLMSSFSFYFGHHMSTIEGGMISTDDYEMYNILLSIRSHGWDRDLPKHEQKKMREANNVDDFRALYTFYYPGFNLRSTDLQAFIGIQQLDKIESVVKARNTNYNLYKKYLNNKFWKIKETKNSYVSNFAFPVIVSNVSELSKILFNHNVENRPLICGSIAEQPFWIKKYGHQYLPNAKTIHDFGMYLPNNPDLTKTEIKQICNLINKYGKCKSYYMQE